MIRRQPPALVRRAAGPVLYRLARLAGGPPPGLRRGRDFAPADLPTVVVVVAGADEGSCAEVLDAVSRAQWASDAFTPVFVVDAPVLSPFRRAGYVVELAGPGGLGAAVAEARRSYAADLVVVAGGRGPEAADALTGLLLAQRPPIEGPVGRSRRFLRAAEARLR
ncbi:hypothetical protein [uncultured Pseudokineococcus sp.]|uniref:hypothetical protein n=1 Tax=uncultured Pseudokineococcus sp. TaxID=1642928 RepID=UPI002633A84A|nr:hypothetical protein [uncultured Pseudokineococcus sp.]